MGLANQGGRSGGIIGEARKGKGKSLFLLPNPFRPLLYAGED